MSGPKGGGYVLSALELARREQARQTRLQAELAPLMAELTALRDQCEIARSSGLSAAPLVALPTIRGTESSTALTGLIAECRTQLTVVRSDLSSARERARLAELSAVFSVGARQSRDRAVAAAHTAAERIRQQVTVERAQSGTSASVDADTRMGALYEQAAAERAAALAALEDAQRRADDAARHSREREEDLRATLVDRVAVAIEVAGVTSDLADVARVRELAEAVDLTAPVADLAAAVGRLEAAAREVVAAAVRRADERDRAATVLAVLAGVDSAEARTLRTRAETALDGGTPLPVDAPDIAVGIVSRVEAQAAHLSVAQALSASLEALGYEVGPSFARVLVEQGRGYAYDDRWSEHALRVRIDPASERLALEVVRREDPRSPAPPSAAAQLRDVEVEEDFCSSLQAIVDGAAGRGVEINIDRRHAAGTTAVARVTDAAPPQAQPSRKHAESPRAMEASE